MRDPIVNTVDGWRRGSSDELPAITRMPRFAAPLRWLTASMFGEVVLPARPDYEVEPGRTFIDVRVSPRGGDGQAGRE
jgi:hypothetical protein